MPPSSERFAIDTTNSTLNFVKNKVEVSGVRCYNTNSFLLSSAVERATVNRLVPGSNPGEGVATLAQLDRAGLL